VKKKMRIIVLIALVLIPEVIAIAQKTGTITGEVFAFKIYPVNKAIVKSIKTGVTVVTDSLGKFTINCVENDNLLISASGFMENKIHIRKVAGIVINLQYGYKETSFNDAVGHNHISGRLLEEALKKYPVKGQKDYSKYSDIFALISTEIVNVRVVGTNVYTTKALSFSMSPQVLYVVDDMIISDISFISPAEVQKIEFFDDNRSSEYGMRGANGVLKITLRKK
jgi:hypothetical protein